MRTVPWTSPPYPARIRPRQPGSQLQPASLPRYDASDANACGASSPPLAPCLPIRSRSLYSAPEPCQPRKRNLPAAFSWMVNDVEPGKLRLPCVLLRFCPGGAGGDGRVCSPRRSSFHRRPPGSSPWSCYRVSRLSVKTLRDDDACEFASAPAVVPLPYDSHLLNANLEIFPSLPRRRLRSERLPKATCWRSNVYEAARERSRRRLSPRTVFFFAIWKNRIDLSTTCRHLSPNPRQIPCDRIRISLFQFFYVRPK